MPALPVALRGWRFADALCSVHRTQGNRRHCPRRSAFSLFGAAFPRRAEQVPTPSLYPTRTSA